MVGGLNDVFLAALADIYFAEIGVTDW